ncbi:MAG: TonB-dependent receptor [Acidobacteriaceae bacterium]
MVTTTVHVTAAAANATDSNEGYERRITAREVEQSAGTFGDPMRFMQMLPGVVSDNDQRNDFIVRGGNPSETLFVIDNIEMPSINQLALSDTTGGFVSMIDNAAVTHMTLHTDAYDSKFDQRLSAVMEMSTRPEGPVGYHMRSEFGVGGTGASMERPLGSGSLFVSLRRSILNLFTDDIGMNGVPIYTNGLLRADGRIDEKNSWWGLSLSGVDSMDIHPSATDSWETDPYNINYGGWRNTTGINWQHIFSARAFGVMSLSNSEQAQSIHETAQLLSNIPIYDEDSRDGITTLKYDGTLQPSSRLTWTAGAQGSLDRMNYNVQQPVPLPNPYSSDPTPQVAMSIERAFTPASFATYAQVAVELPHDIKIVVGERVAQWAIVGRAVATPKVVFFAPVLGARRGMMLHLGYAEYAQLPPSLYLVSFANQHTLAPIHSRHLTAGLSVVDKPRVRLTLNAYQKLYSGYPVAVSFPQLTMANIADTFGQEFLMFPMTSQGRGVARGIEMALDWKPTHRLALSSATTYMRSWYSGLDGVLRKGNFDLPVVANFAGNALLGRGWTGSFRYSGSTGKPYTPDNLTLSEAQDRDVYDLTQINSLRAPMYSRLDFRVEWTRPLRRGSMSVHIGLDNALATSNFYSNEWMPRCLGPGCGTLEQKQMPRFPDGGVRYSY